MRGLRTFFLLLVASFGSLLPTKASPIGFEAIDFWVGEGNNRAALAIDWHGADPTDHAILWGYRWDGAATGAEMLLDIVSADPRLYAKFNDNTSGLGLGVYGFGYDLNGDGEFALDDQTVFDSVGVAISGPADGAQAIGPDRYREGWEDGYWHYGVRSNDEAWASSQAGMSSRQLADGDWDSHAFAVTLNYDEFATNLVAAPAPHSPGDFNADGLVNAADYTIWRDENGQTVEIAGAGADADRSHQVDRFDYAVWRTHYGLPFSASNAVPEPTACALTLCVSLTLFFTPRKRAL